MNVNDGTGAGVVRGESESETEEQTLPIPQHDTPHRRRVVILGAAVDFFQFWRRRFISDKTVLLIL